MAERSVQLDSVYRSNEQYAMLLERRRKITNLVNIVKNESQTARKMAAARELGIVAVEENTECAAMMYALDAAYEVIANAGGMRKDAGFIILRAIDSYLVDIGIGHKYVFDQATDPQNSSRMEVLRRSIERNMKSPTLTRREEEYPSAQYFTTSMLNIFAEARRTGKLAKNRILIGDKSVINAQPPAGETFQTTGAHLNSGLIDQVFQIGGRSMKETIGSSRLFTPLEVMKAFRRVEKPLSGTQPSLYDREIGGTSIRKLDEEQDLNEFARKALIIMGEIPKGELSWQVAIDAILLSHPIGNTDQKTVIYEGENPFSIKAHWFQNFLAANIVEPAYGFYTSPFPFDPMLEKALDRLEMQTSSQIDSIVLTNLANQGALTWQNYQHVSQYRDRLDADKAKVAGIMGFEEFALYKDPNGTIKRLREEMVPLLERSMLHRFGDKSWVMRFLGDLKAKLPEHRVEEDFNTRMKAILIDENDTIPNGARRALSKCEAEELGEIFAENGEAIKAATENQLYNLPTNILSAFALKELSLLSGNMSADGHVFFTITAQGQTSILANTIRGIFKFADGEIDHSDNGTLDPKVKVSLEKYLSIAIYDWLVSKDVVLTRKPHFEIGRMALGYTPALTAEQIENASLEQIAISIYADQGKLTKSAWEKSKFAEPTETKFEDLMRYPGGLAALKAFAEKYVTKDQEVEQDPRENLESLLAYLERQGN